jgi:hypothetical protein
MIRPPNSEEDVNADRIMQVTVNDLGVTRRPLSWILLPGKGLWRRGVDNEAPVRQNIGLYPSDATATQGTSP